MQPTKARMREYALLLFRMTSRVFIVHSTINSTAHSTLQRVTVCLTSGKMIIVSNQIYFNIFYSYLSTSFSTLVFRFLRIMLSIFIRILMPRHELYLKLNLIRGIHPAWIYCHASIAASWPTLNTITLVIRPVFSGMLFMSATIFICTFTFNIYI